MPTPQPVDRALARKDALALNRAGLKDALDRVTKRIDDSRASIWHLPIGHMFRVCREFAFLRGYRGDFLIGDSSQSAAHGNVHVNGQSDRRIFQRLLCNSLSKYRNDAYYLQVLVCRRMAKLFSMSKTGTGVA